MSVAFALAEAGEPPEARGLARDEVRMLVATGDGAVAHVRARDLPGWLRAGDLVVVNTSATLPAALAGRREDGARIRVHLSTPCPSGGTQRWVAELRRDDERVRDGAAGECVVLPAGATATLLAPYLAGERLWVARLEIPVPLTAYLAAHGTPIHYGHVRGDRPLGDYQTMFSAQPGSAEMPSAGRPFTPALVAALVAGGVGVAPLLLHTGVSSQDAGEPPYPERFRVPAATARLVNATRARGGRVVAVGTTVVRALESAARPDGTVVAAQGWTDLVVSPERAVRAVGGLLTGWHAPEASHLLMLEAVAGPELVERSYAAASDEGYRRHEFGDVNLLLPQGR